MYAMKPYYECHITLVGDPEKIQKQVEIWKWSFSKIDGDITLGDGIKCYATRHFNPREGENHIIKKVMMVADIFRANGLKVLREKVELVVWDKRD
jgi:hypothetical protein